MKKSITSILMPAVISLVIISCKKNLDINRSEDITLRDTTVVNGDTPPTSTFSTMVSLFAKGETIPLKWTGSDPENSPALNLEWRVNEKKIGNGPTLSYTPPAAGTYRISLKAGDGNRYSQTTKTIVVKNDLRMVVKLLYLTFSNNIGDGYNKSTKGYLTITALAFDHNNAKKIQQYAYPGDNPSVNSYMFNPNTSYNFSQNSGIIIYDGPVNNSMGFALHVIDYDERSFNWLGFFSGLFDLTKTVLTVVAPSYASIAEGLSKVTKLVSENIKLSPEDNIVGNFQVQLNRGSNHWGALVNDGISYMTDNSYGNYGIRIAYQVKILE